MPHVFYWMLVAVHLGASPPWSLISNDRYSQESDCIAAKLRLPADQSANSECWKVDGRFESMKPR